MLQKVYFEDLGVKSFQPTWDYQETLLAKNTAIKSLAREHNEDVKLTNTEHRFIMVEHPPVFTLGKNGKREHVLVSEEQLEKLGIEFFHINRGGDITYHGPQQIVGYPILDLDKFKTDLGWYLRSLEQVIIDTIAEYGLIGERSAGETGVWIDASLKGKERKICAIGVRCSRWITMHGFALNVNTDLGYFGHIVPCGIQDKQVTSIEKELGRKISVEEVKAMITEAFVDVFDCRMV